MTPPTLQRLRDWQLRLHRLALESDERHWGLLEEVRGFLAWYGEVYLPGRGQDAVIERVLALIAAEEV